MKWSTICLIFFLDLQYSYVLDSSKYATLFTHWKSRVTRDIGGIGGQLGQIEDALKESCERKPELEESIKVMSACIKARPMFTTPKDEYIENIRICSTKPRRLLSECLPSKLQYLPEFIFALTESVVKLMYDDIKEITRGLSSCLPLLKTSKSIEEYEKCVTKVRGAFDDKISGSKTVFCERFIPISNCYVQQINETCTLDDDLEKFTKDYMKAMKKPCVTPNPIN